MKNTRNIDPESLLQQAQALGNDIKEMESIDTFGAYNRTLSKIKISRRQWLYKQLTQYAAFLTLPLLLSSLLLGYLYFHEPEIDEKYAEVKAATGSIIRHELPDHSVVWLNAGSTLRYPTVFRKNNRKVELKGEAYFEVHADHERPFYVNTSSGMSVHAYGTRFNVSAYEDDNYIETVLEKGKVNVTTPDLKTSIKLAPGERAFYDKNLNKLVKEQIDTYEKIAWKEGKLIFRNTSLDEVLKRLARHFNVDIQFNNKSGKEYKYRATFRNETLLQILDYLGKSASLKWQIEEAVQQKDDSFTKKRITVNLY